MLYIVTALKPEAQAFVDMYKLKKTRCENFTLFCDDNIILIVSGVGVANAKTATATLIKNFNLKENDILLNIGICGANKKHKIGEFLEIGSIVYKNEKFVLKKNLSNTLTCKDIEVSIDEDVIVDMESFGFYEASKEIKNRYMYKVVSDHFEPSKVTKDKTKMLIFNVIEEIIKRIGL